MYGMQLMSGAVSPLADMPEFTGLLTTFNNPFLGVLVGAVFTGVIQSSAASVGVLQALAMTGAISYSMAIPIIMGQNIGTCVTALLSSIGVNKNAKRVSIIHISFNLFGTAIGLVVYCIARYAVDLTLFNDSISPVMIAVFHSIFNIATTIILLPFSKYSCKRLLRSLSQLTTQTDRLYSTRDFYSHLDLLSKNVLRRQTRWLSLQETASRML